MYTEIEIHSFGIIQMFNPFGADVYQNSTNQSLKSKNDQITTVLNFKKSTFLSSIISESGSISLVV